jgi:organic hydroperoxide reductase OsmC/OhrA
MREKPESLLLCHTPPSAGTSSGKSVSFEIVRKALIFTAVVLALCGLTEALYVPKFGKAALDAAYGEYSECLHAPPLIERGNRRWPNDFRPSPADCLGAYLDRQEAIHWRYFLFQTLATHLIERSPTHAVIIKITMSEHTASVRWVHQSGDFLKGTYSREHTWTFDCGVVIAASPALSSVSVPYSNPNNVDPEEAFVASISSCHMLTYLYLAYRSGFEVASYEDDAVGFMTKNERGSLWVSSVFLNPKIVYSGEKKPSSEEQTRLHHASHEECYIANSVKTEIKVVPAERA